MDLRASMDKETAKKECPGTEPWSSKIFLNLKLPLSSTHWNSIALPSFALDRGAYSVPPASLMLPRCLAHS